MIRTLINPLLSSLSGALIFFLILCIYSKDLGFATKWASLFVFVSFIFSSIYFFLSLLVREKISSKNYLLILQVPAITTSLFLAYIVSGLTLHGESPFLAMHLYKTIKIFMLFVSTGSFVAFVSWLQAKKTNKRQWFKPN